MKTIAVIPARYASTRFPAKLMAKLGDKTVIRTTYENTVATELFDDVFVVTDSEIIFEEIQKHGGKVLMSQKDHQSGSDRIAEAVENIDCDIVINVQGDEPFVQKSALEKLIEAYKNDTNKEISLATLATEIRHLEDVQNPNCVKVIWDVNQFAIYFSRSAIPYLRDEEFQPKYFQHIGIYAFRKEALLKFTNLESRPLELAEKLEQLRYLEYGMKIKVLETDYMGVGIDTPEDLARAQTYLQQNNA